MRHDLSFRERVISHIVEGGSKASASRLFKLSADTIHRWWLSRDDLAPKHRRPKMSYKLDRARLTELIEKDPDMMLKS